MKRFLIVAFLCLSFFGLANAQLDKQSVKQVQLVANGGYWKSSGTMSGSKDALAAAAKFGCYASLCKVELSKDNLWVMSSGVPKQNLDEFLLMYRQLVSPDKKSSKNKFELEGNLEKSKKNLTKLILDFNPSGTKESEKSLLPLLKKLMKEESIRRLVEFGSSDIALCKALVQEFPEIPVSYTKGDLSPRELKKKGFAGYAVYDYRILKDHPQWLSESSESKITLCVSGMQSAEEVREMLRVGVYRLLTDQVAMTKVWVKNEVPVKLMSFNIRMSGMPDVDGDYAWEKRKEAVVKMINGEKPDVFGVQEMLPDQQEYLRKSLSAYDMVGVGREDGANEGECMGIFFKKSMFTLLKSGTFWLSQTPDEPSLGWDAACRRTVTYVQLMHKASGKTFFYFNTHLDHVGLIARQESVKLICEKIRELVPDTNGVFILGGDMNSPLSQSIFNPLIGERIKSKSLSEVETDGFKNQKSSREMMPMEVKGERTPSLMKSARNSAWERDNMHTYNGFGKDKASQIDHIFVSQRVENLVFRTVRDRYGVSYLSDHYPITLVFVLK